MSTRDLALAVVAVVAIIALGGVAIGRISGANSPTPDPAVPAAIDVDAYEAH